MAASVIALSTALWLGVLTSLSPCPLATNVAAISFVSRRVGQTSQVLLSGLLYALGRMLAYVVLAAVLVAGFLAIPGVSFGLQKYMNMILGPLLIVTAVFVVGIIPINVGAGRLISRFQDKTASMGLAGAGLLGILFALSFCPVSAGLYFGSLIPLSIAHQSRLVLPALYGFGTALPVIVFSLVLAFSAKSIGSVFNKTAQLEKWARWGTAVIFFAVGIYYLIATTFRNN